MATKLPLKCAIALKCQCRKTTDCALQNLLRQRGAAAERTMCRIISGFLKGEQEGTVARNQLPCDGRGAYKGLSSEHEKSLETAITPLLTHENCLSHVAKGRQNGTPSANVGLQL